MSEILLSTCIVPDDAGQVLLLHRMDHDQWQLPGGRVPVGDGEVLASRMAMAETRHKLGIKVQSVQALGATTFKQGEATYDCLWYQSLGHDGDPLLLQPKIYDDWQYFNLFKRGLSRQSLSPNVRHLARALQNEHVQLLY